MSHNRIRPTPGHLGILRLLSFQMVHSTWELQNSFTKTPARPCVASVP